MAEKIENKIEETRQRFKNEYVQDSSEKYDSRDVDRLMKDDSLVEGYLAWRMNVVEDALKMIDESLLWRKEYTVNDLTESCIPKWMFETGAVFLHGYDKEGNKLFWFKVKLHLKDAKTFQDKKKYVAFWLESYAKREPGMPLTVVFDMSESGISNIDMEFVKYIISCFKVYYPKFLSKMIMYEMPWIMNAAWKIVKTWLGPEAISKLKFVSKSEIQGFIDPEYLPPHMGGTDSFKYTYPPLPDDDFQSPVCENGPVVSEDESECKDAEMDCKESLESSFNSEVATKPRKVNFSEDSLKPDDLDKGDGCGRLKGVRRPVTTFKGTLLHIRWVSGGWRMLRMCLLQKHWVELIQPRSSKVVRLHLCFKLSHDRCSDHITAVQEVLFSSITVLTIYKAVYKCRRPALLDPRLHLDGP